jgi:alkaline phosphatase
LSAAAAASVIDAEPMDGSTGFYGTGTYAKAGALARALADERGVVWSTSGHTHTPVPVFSYGPGAEQFAAFLHHTEIGQRLQAQLSR